MKVVGIDPSLTRLGLAVVTAEGVAVATSLTSKAEGLKYADKYARMCYLANWVDGCLHGDETVMIVIEEPIVARNDPGTFDRAGLWWQLFGRCKRKCSMVAIVHPKTRAKWPTGRGDSKKQDVIDAMEVMWPNVARNDDEADALVLASMGAQYLNIGGVEMVANQKQILRGRGCKWPALPGEVLASFANRPRAGVYR